MKQSIWLGLALGIAGCVLVAGSARADTSYDKFEKKVRGIAPRYTTIPGKTLCICQDPSDTHVGALNYGNSAMGPTTTTISAARVVPTFDTVSGAQLSTFSCPKFQIVK